MKLVAIVCGFLVIAGVAGYKQRQPATGPSGTVCESAGGSCVGIANGTNIAYKGNCSKYIVCFLECGCDMTCPDNLHFNSKLQVCDWPENAGCESSGSETPATETPGSGTPVTETPGSGTPVTETPGSGTPVTETPGSGTPVTETPGSGTPVTETPGSGTPVTETPGSGSGPATGPSGTVCESAGGSCVGIANGTNIAYKGNCSKYIVCFLECGCDMSCPDNLHFNSKLQVCDWPDNAGCESSGSETPATETPGSGTPVTETPGSGTPVTETPGSGTPVTETPGSGTPVTETPGSGTPVTETPGSGTPVTETPGSGTPVTETPGSGTPVTETPGSGTTGSGTGPATGPSGTVCESAGGSCVGTEDGKKIPYSGDCQKYVVCFLECGCDMECPPGLNFNADLQVCDWPETAGCASNSTSKFY